MKVSSTSGFTLIELLIAIAILGIFIAVAVPGLVGARSKAIETSANAYARRCLNSLASYTINNPDINLIGMTCTDNAIHPDPKPDYIVSSEVIQTSQGELRLNYTYKKNGQDVNSSIPVNLLK